METQIKTVSFKDVHAELVNESLLLSSFAKREVDVTTFKDKSLFLSRLGFSNSIATRMYKEISEKHIEIRQNNNRYHPYKFILKPQLERVCEKYNLFVRNPEYFLGDIPESNIKEMQNFSFYLSDLNLTYLEIMHIEDLIPRGIGIPSERRVTFSDISNVGIDIRNFILIASVESLFDKSAFAHSRSRIMGKPELVAKSEVDLDPIVLFEIKGGYIIITAWGDEANDELVFNQNQN